MKMEEVEDDQQAPSVSSYTHAAMLKWRLIDQSEENGRRLDGFPTNFHSDVIVVFDLDAEGQFTNLNRSNWSIKY